MPGRSQKAIDRYAKSLVDGLPLRRANRLEQRPVSRRQAEPSQMQDAFRALDFGSGQLFAALGVSPRSHDPVNFAATGVWSATMHSSRKNHVASALAAFAST